MPRTPDDLWAAFETLFATASPSDALLAELQKRAADARAGRPIMETERLSTYQAWIDLVQEFCYHPEVFKLSDLVVLKEGKDRREVTSFETGVWMRRFLFFYQEVGIAPVHQVVDEPTIQEYIWRIVRKVLCPQCIRPELCYEVPLPDGTRVPLSNRPDDLKRLEQNREKVVAWMRHNHDEDEIKATLKVPGKPVEKQEKYGSLTAERMLTFVHKEHGLESGPSFMLDWEHLRGVRDARVVFLSMVLAGKDRASDMRHNVNRIQTRGFDVGETKIKPHVDDDPRTFDGAPGSKLAFKHSGFRGIVGCNQRVWDFLMKFHAKDFAGALAKKGRISKFNLPTKDADVLGLCGLASTRFEILPGAVCLWTSRTIHLPAYKSEKIEMGSFSFLQPPAENTQQTAEDNYKCYQEGVPPACYPSGFVNKGVAGGVRSRHGPSQRHYNMVDWFKKDLEKVIDQHACAKGMRVDPETGEPFTLFIETRQQEIPVWRALPTEQADLDALHALGLSHTQRAMFGLPHDEQVIVLPTAARVGAKRAAHDAEHDAKRPCAAGGSAEEPIVIRDD